MKKGYTKLNLLKLTKQNVQQLIYLSVFDRKKLKDGYNLRKLSLFAVLPLNVCCLVY